MRAYLYLAVVLLYLALTHVSQAGMAEKCQLHLTYAGRVTLELRNSLKEARPGQRLLAQLFVGQSLAFDKGFRRELSQAGLSVVETSGEPGALQRIEVAGTVEALRAALIEGKLSSLFDKVAFAAQDATVETHSLAVEALQSEVTLAAYEHVGEPRLTFEAIRSAEGDAVLVVNVEKNPWLATRLQTRFQHLPISIRLEGTSYALRPEAKQKVSPGLRAAIESPTHAVLETRVIYESKKSPGTVEGISIEHDRTPLGNSYRVKGSPELLAELLARGEVKQATLASEPVFSVEVLKATKEIQVNLHLSELGRKAAREFLEKHASAVKLISNGTWYEGSDFIEFYPRVSKMDVRVQLPAKLLPELISKMDSFSHIDAGPPARIRANERDDSGEI